MLPSRFIIAAALATARALPQTGPGNTQSASGVIERPRGFQWGRAVWQSFFFAGIEHSLRLTQAKTRNEFQGKFFEDYRQSVTNIHGWGDGDSAFTNYVAHPMQGAVAGFMQIQNDPAGIGREFGRDGACWRGRFKSMAWPAAYSTQFEIGPISEATIGNVGKKRGTTGHTDLVVTPVGGLEHDGPGGCCGPVHHLSLRVARHGSGLAALPASGIEPAAQPCQPVAV